MKKAKKKATIYIRRKCIERLAWEIIAEADWEMHLAILRNCCMQGDCEYEEFRGKLYPVKLTPWTFAAVKKRVDKYKKVGSDG